ncbi:MAG: DUF935 family protein [Magnetospirillum sp.]|nr:DUF935 family protein [Magnetospirillum sp.]
MLKGEWGFRYDRVCYEQLGATLKGYAVGEVMWDVRDGFIVPIDVKPKDQRRFVFDDEQQLRMLTFEDMLRGEELPPRKFLVHRFGDMVGDPYGLGIGSMLFWPCFFKRQGIAFWLTFCEKFGSPTVVGEAPDGMLDTEKDKLLDVLSSISQRSAMTVPQGTVVKLLEAVRSGTINTYEDLCRYMDEMITLAILGETLTSSIRGGGSRAASETHNVVREELADFDADLLCAAHTEQFIEWIVSLNYPEARRPLISRPRMAREEEEATRDQKQIQARQMALAFITQARQEGWEPKDPTLDIMDQWKGEWVYTGLTSGPAAPIGEVTPQTIRADSEFAAPPGAAPGDVTPRDAADDLADQLAEAAMPAMTDLMGQIKALVNRAASLEDLSAELVRLYPKLDASDLALAMSQALQVAELTGRSEMVLP